MNGPIQGEQLCQILFNLPFQWEPTLEEKILFQLKQILCLKRRVHFKGVSATTEGKRKTKFNINCVSLCNKWNNVL